MQAFASRLVRWQRRHGRHDLPWQRGRDAYRVWLSEVMLQQTRVETVIPYFERFVARFRDVRSLAAAPLGEVLRLWSGLGYYARARNLHAAARQVMQVHAGRLPDRAAVLQELPGIGRSTAGAIAALAFGRRAAMLDANARRVLGRCFGIEEEKALWRLAAALVPARSTGAYTQGLMDLGAMICTPTDPACAQCPASADCVTHRKGVVPRQEPKRAGRALPIRNSRWLVLVHRDRVLLERRPPRGVWGGLWTFPEADSDDVEADATRRACRIASRRKLSPFEHAFTHLRLRVQPILCQVNDVYPAVRQRGRRWFRLSEVGTAAVPAPVRKLLLPLRPASSRPQGIRANLSSPS